MRESKWRKTRLTSGSDDGIGHFHSYYDIPVTRGDEVVCVRMTLDGRHPTEGDAVEVGLVDSTRPGSWTALGRSTAWSWQQGPMAQVLPGSGDVIYNDRAGGRIVARRSGSRTATLPRPVYALDPGGAFALCLDMGRLDHLRPGYGYPTGDADLRPHPEDAGIWRMDLESGADRLILPLAEAVAFTLRHLPLRDRLRHRVARYTYWFNHAKIAPDGKRFTVKLRWRKPGGPWNGTMGVSLTASCEGGGLRLLVRASSHVIWDGPERLFLWQEKPARLLRIRDTGPTGTVEPWDLARHIAANVHLRRMGGGFVWDTPYRETVELLYGDGEGAEVVARFDGHRPARGPFRCDLHPNPFPDGRRVVICSPEDGRRQVYLLERP